MEKLEVLVWSREELAFGANVFWSRFSPKESPKVSGSGASSASTGAVSISSAMFFLL
jgi:hypothetical protein